MQFESPPKESWELTAVHGAIRVGSILAPLLQLPPVPSGVLGLRVQANNPACIFSVVLHQINLL